MAGLDDVVFDQDGVPTTPSGRLYIAPARNAGDAEGVVNGNDSAAPDLIPTNNNRLTQALAPQPTLLDRIAALKDALLGPVGQFMDYDQQFTRNVLDLPQTMRNNPEATRQVMRSITGMDERHTSPGKTGRPAVTSDGTDRQQTWPERMVREGATAPGDVSKPNPYPPGSEEWDWYEDQRSNAMVPAALAVAALAGGGALTERPGVATLGSGPVRQGMKPSLVPAIKWKGRIYKDEPGVNHVDMGPPDMQEFMDRNGIDQVHDIPEKTPGFGIGFIDHKGRFLSRDGDAVGEYAKQYPEVIHPEYRKYLTGKGGISSDWLAFSDTQQPAAAVAALKPAPVFYSALEHAATNAAQDTMAPQQWLGYLKNQPGVKKEELDWSGLEGWLGTQKGKVNKQDVQSYLDAHKTEIKDVTKGGANIDEDSIGNRAAELMERDHPNMRDGTDEWWDRYQDKVEEAEEELRSQGIGTKYSSYQLPGGENYREHLLTLPSRAQPSHTAIQFEQLLADKGYKIGTGRQLLKTDGTLVDPIHAPDDVANAFHGWLKASDKDYRVETGYDTNYHSSHWDEPNVLAHVRTNDRTFSDSNIKGPPGWTAKKSEGAMDRALVGQPGEGGGPSYNVYDANGKYQGFASAGSPDEAVVKLIQDDSSVARRAGFLKDNSPTELERWQNYKGHEGELKKSLHIEEIQSDWHQQGRKQGYQSDGPSLNDVVAAEKKANVSYQKLLGMLQEAQPSVRKESIRSMANELTEKATNGEPLGTFHTKEERDLAAQWAQEWGQYQDLNSKYQIAKSNVPDAPFKSSWPELALKRMIRHAAENGYDRISWTPGEAQAARYDLSKHYDGLEVHKLRDGLWQINGKPAGQSSGMTSYTKVATAVPTDKLADFVGKDLAEQIAGQRQRVKEYSGADLKVGGEGMREFYDKMLPKMVEKIGKAYGVKVKQTTIGHMEPKQNKDGKWYLQDKEENGGFATKLYNTREEAVKAHAQFVHYFDLPQSLKDAALHRGFPLYMTGVPFPLIPVEHDPFQKDK